MINDLIPKVKDQNIMQCNVKPQQLSRIANLVFEEKINYKIAKTIIDEMLKTGEEPENVIERKGLIQNSNKDAIVGIVKQVISNNPNQVQQYKNGNEKVLQYLVGQVMRESKGKANPKLVNEILKEQI